MLMGIRNILIITNPADKVKFMDLLGDGSKWGISIRFLIQEEANGLADAFLLTEKYIKTKKIALILGDNIFYGHDLVKQLVKSTKDEVGATLFAYPVNNPERYGVIEFDKFNNVKKIIEKPKGSKSKYANTGLYLYDAKAIEYVKRLKPSKRGELELTDLNNIYLKNDDLKVEILGRGMTWIDAGTFESMIEACLFIKTIENRQGLKIGCPEEISWRKKWISTENLSEIASLYPENSYKYYLKELLERKVFESDFLI
tara:strand:- start:237 stop:1007 length:771 start_codon:yes stop_codon:yes gene_type:complete